MHQAKQHILVADDQPENLVVLEAVLADEFSVHTVSDGQQVLDHLGAGRPADLIMLDVMMPTLDGLSTCRRVKADAATRDIPVLFLSGLDSAADEATALALGAEDFIHKPFSPPVVVARVRNHLRFARARQALRSQNQDLERLVAERTRDLRRQSDELMAQKQELISAQSVTINAFCALAEARDNETGNHIRRTQGYVRALAERLRQHPRFADQLDDERIELLYRSAPLHDVGKVAIPDAILLKPGKLTPEEWRVMKTHCQQGFNAIQSAAQGLDGSADFLRFAREIALCHHERYDGEGYPAGLAGDAIPLSARLMTVADVYDALISRRCYKPAYPHAQAIEMMAAERGRQFDPDVLDALLSADDP
jgi:putative two-component system response regulator